MINQRLLYILLIISLFYSSCSEGISESENCDASSELLSAFTNQEGDQIQIYKNGKTYKADNNCQPLESYFDPSFYDLNYINLPEGTFLRVDDTTYYAPQNSFVEDFENAKHFLDLFVRDAQDRDHLFTQFTLQSPATPTSQEYNELRSCISNGQCDFIDNKIELARDPLKPENQVLKFYAVAPSPDMVTSKASIATSIIFLKEGDEIWYEADYFADGPNMPKTIVDFESSHFLGSPGPRILFRDSHINVENKFGVKLNYEQTASPQIAFPNKEWVTLKVHFLYDEDEGMIQVWQNNELIIDHIGRNIPFDLWIQNILEIGISATQEEATLYLDNVRISESAF